MGPAQKFKKHVTQLLISQRGLNLKKKKRRQLTWEFSVRTANKKSADGEGKSLISDKRSWENCKQEDKLWKRNKSLQFSFFASYHFYFFDDFFFAFYFLLLLCYFKC